MFAFADDGLLYDVVETYSNVPAKGVPGDPTGLTALGGAGTNTMFITVSHDGGTTFGPVVRVWDGATPAVLQDRTMIVANPKTGSAHFAWSQRQDLASSAQLLVSTSRDHGATWGLPVVVSAPDAKFNVPAALTATDDGKVVAFWLSSDGFGARTPGDLWVASSGDDGASFGAPVHVAQTNVVLLPSIPNSKFYVANNPQVAVDRSQGPRHGWLYAVWDENVSGHLDPRISVSRDGGATWSAPRSVSGDPDAHDRFHPALAVDAAGAVHVTYNDRRYDPGNKLLDLSWAIAPDGSDFTSFRVTNSSFDGDLGFHQTGVPFIGDYNGLGCSGAVCYASFADTRDGRSELAVARLVR
jgi:hypothetical protein